MSNTTENMRVASRALRLDQKLRVVDAPQSILEVLDVEFTRLGSGCQ
jgi:hypothetical protein